jgi:class 3 adenylate cyclase
MGINTGLSVFASILRTNDRALDITGDAINVAARLQSGPHLDTAQTAPATHDYVPKLNYLMHKTENPVLKGKGEPVVIYLLVGGGSISFGPQ